MRLCDQVLSVINGNASSSKEFNFLRNYFGLRRDGVVKNFIHFGPRRTKNFVYLWFRNGNATEWHKKILQVGIPSTSRRKARFAISLNQTDFTQHQDLITATIVETVKEFEGR